MKNFSYKKYFFRRNKQKIESIDYLSLLTKFQKTMRVIKGKRVKRDTIL